MSTSQKQIDANRKNAKKSIGSKTESGKAHSSMNDDMACATPASPDSSEHAKENVPDLGAPVTQAPEAKSSNGRKRPRER